MDADFKDIMIGNLTADAQAGAALTRMADRNATHALTTVQNLVVQSQSTVSDDAEKLMAFQAAVGSPKQGSHGG